MSEDFVNGDFMCVGKRLSIFGLSVEFRCGWFECDGFDWFLFLERDSVTFIIYFFVLHQGRLGTVVKIEADLFIIFVHLSLDAPTWHRILLGLPHLQF